MKNKASNPDSDYTNVLESDFGKDLIIDNLLDTVAKQKQEIYDLTRRHLASNLYEAGFRLFRFKEDSDLNILSVTFPLNYHYTPQEEQDDEE